MEIIKKDGSSIELVRFFEYQGKKFLIFNNGEGTDANGHITIHICNVDMNNGVVASSVQSADMDMVRSVIKTIVNENRNGSLLSIKDLNYNDLNGVTIISDWPLKMMPNYIDIIKMNQPVFATPANPVPDQEIVNSFENSLFNDQSIVNSMGVNNSMASNDNANQGLFENNSTFNPFQNVQSQQSMFNNSSINNNTNLQNDIQQNTINDDMKKDYEKLYLEQVSLTNKLNEELEMYKSKIEQLKSIIEN